MKFDFTINPLISINPEICSGCPVIEGTRINPEIIYNMNKAGDSRDMLSQLYDLPYHKIDAAIEYGRIKNQKKLPF